MLKEAGQLKLNQQRLSMRKQINKLVWGIAALLAGFSTCMRAEYLTPPVCSLPSMSGITTTEAVGNTDPISMTLATAYQDGAYHTELMRITDHTTLGDATSVHDYSKLPAWDASGNYILLHTKDIIDASTGSLLHTIDYHWPDYGESPKWSPTEAGVIYYQGGVLSGQTDPLGLPCATGVPRLMKYTLSSGGTVGTPSLVECFTEYSDLGAEAFYEAMSNDGKYVAMTGQRVSDGEWESFLYDVTTNTKTTPVASPSGQQPEWVAPSQSGDYLLILHAGAPNLGTYAYDHSGNFEGIVQRGTGHSDTTIDPDGTEWLVVNNANSNDTYGLPGGYYHVKARIPDGYTAWAAGDTTAVVALLQEPWGWGDTHISCRNIDDPGYCVVTNNTDVDSSTTPVGTMQGEVFKLYLDSTLSVPHVKRLTQHQSMPQWVTDTPGCTDVTNYWAQPHASVSADGSRIIFGSTFGENCWSEDYVMQAQPENVPASGFTINSSSPLYGMPSAEGSQIASLQALGNDSWYDLGIPSSDPNYVVPFGRSYNPRMAYASDIKGAYFMGEYKHGWYDTTTGLYGDSVTVYDVNANAWVWVEHGTNVNTVSLTLNADGYEQDSQGELQPTAATGHGYEMYTYDDDLHRLVQITGALNVYWVDTPMGTRRLTWLPSELTPIDWADTPWQYSTKTGKWIRTPVSATNPGIGSSPSRSSIFWYVPTNKKVFFHEIAQDTWWYDPSTNLWSQVDTSGTDLPFTDGNQVSTYDSSRDRVWILGAASSDDLQLWYFDVATETYHQQSITNLTWTDATHFLTGNYGMYYDSHNDIILVKNNNDFYTIDLATNTLNATAITKPGTMNTTDLVISAFYDPDLNVFFIWIGDIDTHPTAHRMWAYRYAS